MFIDPFSSSDAAEETIPSLNPFLVKADEVLNTTVAFSDGVIYTSRTHSHEMFGNKLTIYMFCKENCKISLIS